jgi:hypothetical protein
MRICRLASVTLSRPAPPALGRWTYTSGTGLQVRTLAPLQGAKDITDVNVADRPKSNAPGVMWPRRDESTSALIVTELDAGAVEAGPDGAIELDQNARRSAEQALVDCADLLAVYHQCRRLLGSPSPCLALRPESDDEFGLLRRSQGIAPSSQALGRAMICPQFGPQTDLRLIGDRTDGVALLADSLAEESAAGRVRDLFRVLERAFSVGPYTQIDPLHAFLQSGPKDMSYDRDEIAYWMTELRSTVTHADRRDDYARGADVEPYLGRIEYATYDVLFNKMTWRDPSPSRRAGLRLSAGIDRDGTICVFRRGARIVIQWLDPFGTFYLDQRARVNLGDDWYSKVMNHPDPTEGPQEYRSTVQFRTDFYADEA